MAYNFDYYRIFFSAAKHKNITSAANELFLSQPTISRSIQKLEHELGCTLLVRTNQGVELTAEGRLLYRHVEKAVESIETVEEKLMQIKNLEDGMVHICATEMTMQYFLPSFLEKFKTEYPGIRFRLSIGLPKTLFPQLHSGSVDLAVFTTPLAVDGTIALTVLKEYREILIAGEKFCRFTDRPRHLAELAGEPFILMQPGTTARNYIEQYFKEHKVSVQSEFDVSMMPVIGPMVQANMGLGFVPPFYVEEQLKQGLVREIELEEELPVRQICLCTSKTYPQSAACKAFIRCLRAAVG
ncbi:MAG: LysR family transcriptional regulator [Eubacterium sp.]|nr:LysR family transcriptional regulator [Eubacterium sp.]